MPEIRSESEYLDRFPQTEFKETLRSKAHQTALDIRKFEIELYWKRATYFWTLIAASFAGYFGLQVAECAASLRLLSLLVSCLGFMLSLGWYLVNRGSKYWQTNWERHVDLLEKEITGPLYKITMSRQECPLWKFWRGYPYSVSRINQLISLFVALVWLCIVFRALPSAPFGASGESLAQWLLVCLTLLFTILLVTLGQGGSEGRARKVNFRESPLVSTDSR